MKLSLIIPCYNCSSEIAARIRIVLNDLREISDYEIIPVDDGSSDNTYEMLESVQEECVRPIQLTKNQGKFAALKAGVAESRGDVVIFTDADIAYGTNAILQFYRIISSRHFHVVAGDRTLTAGHEQSASVLRDLASKSFRVAIRLLLTGGLFDTQCGIKGFRGDVARALFPLLRENRFAGDVELLYVALKYNLEIRRVPVSVQNHAPSTVRLRRDILPMIRRIFFLPKDWWSGTYESKSLRKIVLDSYDNPPRK